MITTRVAVALAAVVALLLSRSAVSQTPDKPTAAAATPGKTNPYTSEADVRRGQMAVRAWCSVCHGPEGKGGRGPNLISGTLRRGTSDEAILNNLKNGIAGTDMAGFGDLGDEDQLYWQVISYLRAAATPPPLPPSGDKENGKKLFTKHNCTNCHWAEGRGGRRGPDLSASGAAVEYLRESILDPDANFREQPAYQHAPYQRVAVVTMRGETFEGRWMNENGYFIQLIDDKEQLRTLPKADVDEMAKPGQSLMPSFAALLNDRQLYDLITYVYSLRPQLETKEGK